LFAYTRGCKTITVREVKGVRRSTTTKTKSLTVFLLKEHVKSFDDALKDTKKLQRHELNSEIPFAGALFVDKESITPPRWVEFIQPGLVNELSVKPNVSTSSVLMLEIDGRFFAYAFGYGRYLLKPDSYEMDFGLRVALNEVDADNLRSVDVRTFEELAIDTRRQTSRGSTLETFGLDVSRDLLRLVTGEPRDPTFAKRITGADSLTITAQVELKDLGSKCRHMLKAYKDNKYKERFGWVDHLRRIRDKSKKMELDMELLEVIKTGSTDRLSLAPPEIQDWQNVGGFAYSTQSDQSIKYADLDIHDYLDTIDDVSVLDLKNLLKHRVLFVRADSEQMHDKWSVYKCIIFEIELDKSLFVLINGEWYEIAKNFADSINTYIDSITVCGLALPDAHVDEDEGHYNERVANLVSDVILMDKKCIKPANAATGIEVCDLFSGKCQFIHVKKWSRSSTLSHLFSQGINSALSFLRDEEFRRLYRAKVKELNPTYAALVPLERPDPKYFEVVYAVIRKTSTDGLGSLPFFSKLNMKQAIQQLDMIGYRTSVLQIGISKDKQYAPL